MALLAKHVRMILLCVRLCFCLVIDLSAQRRHDVKATMYAQIVWMRYGLAFDKNAYGLALRSCFGSASAMCDVGSMVGRKIEDQDNNGECRFGEDSTNAWVVRK